MSPATASGPRSKKDAKDADGYLQISTISAVHQQHKDSVVRIVLAGVIAEFSSGAVLAY